MAKSTARVTVTTEWEFESKRLPHNNGKYGYYRHDGTWINEDPTYWAAEDDERDASYKATRFDATGNIRSREVTTVTHNKVAKKPLHVEIFTNDWVIKKQNLI